MPEDAEGDHLVKNAAEVLAAAHSADGIGVGNDNPGQLDSRCALQVMRKAIQSIQSILHGGSGGHEDSSFRSTSKKLEHERVRVERKKLYSGGRQLTAVMARATEEADADTRV